MSFRCPACGNGSSLAIMRKLELPPDARSDEITLQVVRCGACGFSGLAVYEESRRGGFDDDHWSHTGYRVPGEDVQTVERALSRCPRPGNRRCTCAAHRTYGRRDASARWCGLDGLDLGAPFSMDR